MLQERPGSCSEGCVACFSLLGLVPMRATMKSRALVDMLHRTMMDCWDNGTFLVL